MVSTRTLSAVCVVGRREPAEYDDEEEAPHERRGCRRDQQASELLLAVRHELKSLQCDKCDSLLGRCGLGVHGKCITHTISVVAALLNSPAPIKSDT